MGIPVCWGRDAGGAGPDGRSRRSPGYRLWVRVRAPREDVCRGYSPSAEELQLPVVMTAAFSAPGQ